MERGMFDSISPVTRFYIKNCGGWRRRGLSGGEAILWDLVLTDDKLTCDVLQVRRDH